MFRISKPASRVLSLLLAAVMVFGMLPGTAFAADTASHVSAVVNAVTDEPTGESVLVIAGSDYQATDAATTMKNLMNKIKAFHGDAFGVLMGGDYSSGSTNAGNIVTVQSNITDVFPSIDTSNIIFAMGNHDGQMGGLTPENSILSTTGPHDTGFYGVYNINYSDFSSAAGDLTTYLNEKVSEGYSKPIFVLSHQPLFATSRNDKDSTAIFSALNTAAGQGLNIFFLSGHNHSSTYDDYLGGGAIYLKKGDTMKVKGGSTTKTLNFTVLNYGYVGYCNSRADNALTMTAFEIYENAVVVKRYDANGLHLLKAKGVSSSSTYPANTAEYGYAIVDLTTGESTIKNLDDSDHSDSGSGDSGSESGGKVVELSAKTSNGDAKSASIAVGEKLTVKLTNGSSSSKTYTITSSNSAVANVADSIRISGSSTGEIEITGLADGVTTITFSASSSGSGSYTATLTLTVGGGNTEEPDDPDIPVAPGFGSNIGITSDMHDKTDYLRNWLTNVQKAVDPDLEYMVFGGDFTSNRSITSFNSAVSIVNELVGQNKGVYTTGNHEYDSSSVATQMANTTGFKRIGLAVDAPNYDIFNLGVGSDNRGSISFADADVTALEAYLQSAPSDEPIFVVSHYPLHYIKSRAVDGADTMINLLNMYPNVIFLWGHNHSQSAETHYGEIKVAGDSIQYGSASSNTMEISFTYANAGAMNGSQSPYYGLIANISDDGSKVIMQYYNSNGSTAGAAVTVATEGHVHSLQSVAKVAATCTTEGMEAHYYCQCGRYFSDAAAKNEVTKASLVIANTGHTEVIDAAVEATCTETGLTEGKHCSVCNTVLVGQTVVEAKGHDEVVIPGKDATCLASGLTAGKICSVCGSTTVDQTVIPALGHDVQRYDEGPATCTEPGCHSGAYCARCDWTEGGGVINAKGHTEVIDAAVEATCTASGLTAGKHCSVCNEILIAQETVPAKGHTEVIDAALEATCTATGLTEGKHCSVCGEVLVAQIVTPVADHVIVMIPGYAATCQETGLSDGKMCAVCQIILVEQTVISKLPHNEVAIPGYPATCLEPGLTEGMGCSACTIVTVPQQVIAALGHDIIVDSAVAPTCTVPGIAAGEHCSRCDHAVIGEEIPALGHTEVIDTAVEATCTETGLTEGKHCSVCGEVLVAQKTVPAKGHAEVVDAAVEATCTASGLTEGKHCSVCGEVLVAQETVPAKGHTEVIDAAVEATCTEIGLTEGKHCSVCNEILIAQEVVPAKGHTEVIDAAVEASCTATGLTEGKHCSVCGEVLVAQETVPAKGHTEVIDAAVESTCTATGLTEGKHCSVCNEILIAQETVPALGHTEVIDAAVEATCTETGLTEGKHCSVCGEVLVAQETVPAKGHSYTDGVCGECGDIAVEAPVVTASNNAKTGKVKLNWNAVEGAVEYRIYRATKKDGEYKLMYTTSNTTYTNTKAAACKYYYYKVVAVTAEGVTAASEIVGRTCDLARPEVTASNVAKTGKVKLTWNAVEGAVSYKVYRAASKNGEYKLMKTTENTTYTNTNADAGVTYYYKVVAVAEKSAANSAAAQVSRTCDLPQVKVTGRVTSTGNPKLTWEKVEGAASYKVYRAESQNGTYKLMKTTTGTSYSNTSHVDGTTYYYYVVAVAENTDANSAASAVITLTAK